MVWSLNIHTLPWWCLWVTDQSNNNSYFIIILFHIKLSLFLSHQNRLVFAMYGSKVYMSIISWSLSSFEVVLLTSQS